MISVVRKAIIGSEPIELQAMKNALKIPLSVTADDAYIGILISAARGQAETLTDSVLVRSQFVQYMDNFPGWHSHDRGFGHATQGLDLHTNRHHGDVIIRRTPLISVDPILYVGNDGLTGMLVPGTDFVVDGAHQPGRIRPIPGGTWPLTMRTPNAIAIPFTAGYAPNPSGVAAGESVVSEPETITEGTVPTPAKQQASYVIDWSLPNTVTLAIMQLVTHWYFNREPVTQGGASTVPLHVLDLLATVSTPDYTPSES